MPCIACRFMVHRRIALFIIVMSCAHLAGSNPMQDTSIVEMLKNNIKQSGKSTLDKMIFAAHDALQRFHEAMPSQLERQCYVGSCDFSKVTKMVEDQEEATMYWSILSCVKYGVACGEEPAWADWEEWGRCSARCGMGQQVRWRECNIGEYWGVRCQSEYTEMRECEHYNKMDCTADPSTPEDWGSWGLWGSCSDRDSRFCGRRGKVVRERLCLPSRLSMYCLGSDKEERECLHRPSCSVDGEWGKWSHWSNCVTLACERGISFRTRRCSNPAPKGFGHLCVGSAAEIQFCGPSSCDSGDANPVAHFNDHSSLVYLPHQTVPYLSIVLRFRPVTSHGFLLRHTGVPHDVPLSLISKTVQISIKKPLYNASYEDEEFVAMFLEAGRLIVSLIVNGSDPIFIEAGRVKLTEWNIVRLLIVSDVISVRTNDGENVQATLQDSPKKKEVLNSSESSLWGSIFGKDGVGSILINPLKRKTRAILARLKGRISLGKYKQQLSFRGYISQLQVNDLDYSLSSRGLSETSSMVDPVVSKEVEIIPPEEVHGFHHLQTPYFDGLKRMFLPFILKWWIESFQTDDVSKGKDLTSSDVAFLDVTFKPEVGDGIILWNRGKHDLACQWKLAIEDGVRVKFVVANQGGKVFVLSSDNSIVVRRWNTVSILFFRGGETRIQANKGEIRSLKLPSVTKRDMPGPVLIVGGNRNFKPLREDAGSQSQRHLSAYQGYIYSIKQNGVEFLVNGREMINNHRMPKSSFMSRPVITHFWYFTPTFQNEPETKPLDVINLTWSDEIYNKILGVWRNIGKRSAPLQNVDSSSTVTNKTGEHNKTEAENKFVKTDSTATLWLNETIETIRTDPRSREIACVIPVANIFTTAPQITWYKDDLPIAGNKKYVIKDNNAHSSVRSSLFLKPTADGSRELSGVYSCVVNDEGHYWLFASHVVAVLHNNIANPGDLLTGMLIFIKNRTGYSQPIAVLIATGAVAGALLILLLICLCWKRLKKSKRKKKKAGKKRKKKTDDKTGEKDALIPPQQAKRRSASQLSKAERRGDEERKIRKSSTFEPSSGWRFYDDVSSSDSLLLSDSDDIIDADVYEDSLYYY